MFANIADAGSDFDWESIPVVQIVVSNTASASKFVDDNDWVHRLFHRPKLFRPLSHHFTNNPSELDQVLPMEMLSVIVSHTSDARNVSVSSINRQFVKGCSFESPNYTQKKRLAAVLTAKMNERKASNISIRSSDKSDKISDNGRNLAETHTTAQRDTLTKVSETDLVSSHVDVKRQIMITTGSEQRAGTPGRMDVDVLPADSLAVIAETVPVDMFAEVKAAALELQEVQGGANQVDKVNLPVEQCGKAMSLYDVCEGDRLKHIAAPLQLKPRIVTSVMSASTAAVPSLHIIGQSFDLQIAPVGAVLSTKDSVKLLPFEFKAQSETANGTEASSLSTEQVGKVLPTAWLDPKPPVEQCQKLQQSNIPVLITGKTAETVAVSMTAMDGIQCPDVQQIPVVVRGTKAETLPVTSATATNSCATQTSRTICNRVDDELTVICRKLDAVRKVVQRKVFVIDSLDSELLSIHRQLLDLSWKHGNLQKNPELTTASCWGTEETGQVTSPTPIRQSEGFSFTQYVYQKKEPERRSRPLWRQSGNAGGTRRLSGGGLCRDDRININKQRLVTRALPLPVRSNNMIDRKEASASPGRSIAMYRDLRRRRSRRCRSRVRQRITTSERRSVSRAKNSGSSSRRRRSTSSERSRTSNKRNEPVRRSSGSSSRSASTQRSKSHVSRRRKDSREKQSSSSVRSSVSRRRQSVSSERSRASNTRANSTANTGRRRSARSSRSVSSTRRSRSKSRSSGQHSNSQRSRHSSSSRSTASSCRGSHSSARSHASKGHENSARHSTSSVSTVQGPSSRHSPAPAVQHRSVSVESTANLVDLDLTPEWRGRSGSWPGKSSAVSTPEIRASSPESVTGRAVALVARVHEHLRPRIVRSSSRSSSSRSTSRDSREKSLPAASRHSSSGSASSTTCSTCSTSSSSYTEL